MSASVIIPEIPSLQSRSRSTAGSGSRKKSGRTPSGLPSARVITCRSGWTDASSVVIVPASMSSWTTEWSMLTWSRRPSVKR